MQKLKKPVSVILSILMIVSLFAAVPMTVNAAPPGGSGSGEIGTEIGGSTPVITPTTAGDVAEIGGTGYATLAAAINAAQTGDTIKLLASVEETLTISNKTLTIDLNGFNIISKTKSQPITADNGTKLTIVNTNTDKAENTPTQNAIMGPSGGNNYGSLIAKGNTTVEINAGYYYGYNGNKTAIHALNGATITINDCVVNGAQGIDDTTTGKEGKVFYSGVSNPTQPYATSPGTIIVHGGTFAGRMSDSNWGNYVIDGGTFDRNTVILNENPVDANGNRVATASGSMATLPNSPGTLEEAGWLAPGYNVVNNGNGTYGVEKTKAVEAYDANGDLVGAYTSIDAAIEAGGDGCTVKLVADLYEQQQINSQKTPVTLDLNGHMINVEGGAGLNFSMGYYWNGDHIFTVKDTVGTGGINITPKYTGNACISDNTGRTIIVEGGTFTSTGKAIYCTASNATFTVIGGTFNGDIYVHDTGYGHGTLAITDGTVNGTLSAVDNAVLEVSGGVFNAPVPEVYCADGYKPVDNGNGTYGVTPKTYVAQVGDVKYETFAEAVAARTSTNDVIELIKAAGTYTMTDVDEAPIKVQKNSKSVTIKAPANVPKVVTSATADGVTTYTLSDATVKHTAKNGNVTYYTASDLSSLNSDGTYQLLTDITRTQRMAFGNWANDVTIDLNGHTLTSTASDCAVTLGRAGSAASPKTFALVDTSTNKGGKLVFTTAPSTNTEAILVSGKYNNVTIGEGVTVQGGAVALMGENQTLTVNGTINGGDDFAIVTNGSSTKNATITVNDGAVVTSNSTAMYLPGTGTTTINGGTITGDTAIYIKSGTLDVKGGTITGNGAKADYTYNGSGANATGDAIVVDSCGYPGGAPTVTISGNPTVTSTNGKQIGDYSYGDNALGEVTATSNTMTLPTGLKWVETATEGVYEVAPDYVAEVNGTGYMTFAEAVAARTSKDDVISLFKAAGTYTMASADEAPIKVQKNSKSVTIKAPANVPKVVTSATADGVTTYTLSDATVKHTAKNGNVTYYTASDLSSLNSDGTYQLLTDITRTQRMAFGNWANDVTIDLNGHTLTSTASDCAVTLGRAGSAASPKTFALVDTSTNKGGKLVFTTAPSTNTEAILVSGKYNNVTIGEGVTVQGGAVALMGENQTLTVNGTINGGDDFAIVTNGSSTKNATITVNDGAVVTSNSTAMYLPGTGTTTINGGTITGDTAIYIKSGTLDVKGGTITGNGAKADYTYNGSGANATGDAIVVDSCGYPGGAPTVTISGNPTVTSTNGKQIGDYSYGNNALGEVTATSSTMTLPTGLKWVETDTPGVYEVGQKLFVGHNLLLGGDIGVNFYLNPVILDSYNGTKTVKFTCDGEETTVAVPATADAKGYKVTLNVVAARMAHKINAVVYVNNGSTALAETDSYSVQDYAEAVFAEPAKYTTANKADALKALAKAMLNYGAQAQNVFASSLKDKTPAPANTTVGNNGYSAVTVGDVQNAINGDASDLTAIAAQLNAEYYTSSLIYLQNNTLRIYFTPKSKQLGDLDGMGFDDNLSDYYYYKDVEGIAAAELDEQKEFKVGNVTFNYSALDYVVAVLNSNKMGPAQQNLAKSLFLYNQAANAYFD